MAAVPELAPLTGGLRPLPRELRRSANVMASLDSRPPRASLVNLVDNTELPFLFNPQSWEETIQAKYNRGLVVGLSHERLSYKNTSNNVIPLELILSQMAQDRLANEADSTPPIRQQKAWLQSLAYPQSSQDFGFVGPPQVLFIWPGEARLIGRITKASFMRRTFSNRSLRATLIVAKLTFEEDVEQRRLMEDVQLMGSLVASEDL